jgi:hypothetical protein
MDKDSISVEDKNESEYEFTCIVANDDSFQRTIVEFILK